MSGLDIEGVLRDHEPVLGRMGPLAGIVGCSCLSARDYRAAGLKAGQAGHRAHVAAVLREQIAAWLVAEADWRWEPDSEIPAVLAELAALVAPSRVPGEET